jgi:DNA-binding CsgD family transcriptional regulator
VVREALFPDDAQGNGEAAEIATLTKREREVIALVGAGWKNEQIADRLSITLTTVKHHLTSIFDKLGVTDRFGLVFYAHKHGLASPAQYLSKRSVKPEFRTKARELICATFWGSAFRLRMEFRL